MNRWLGKSILVLSLAAAAVPLQAYNYPQCLGYSKRWEGTSTLLFPHQSSFDTQYPQFKASLESARSAWVNAPGEKFGVNFQYTPGPVAYLNDDVSSIVITDGFYQSFPGNSIFQAMTIIRYDSCTAFVEYGSILEADVFFNFQTYPASQWSNVLEPSPNDVSSKYNFGLIAMHELGHAGFGLDHENSVLAAMNSVYPFGGVIGRDHYQPHGDDIKGARAGYGTSVATYDLAASPYRSTGSGNSAPLQAPASTTYRGYTYTFPFTVENRGTYNMSSVVVGFYLSQDRVITPNETYLGSATLSLNAGATSTGNVTVTIPTSVTPGTWYFGWIIDPNNTVTEGDRVNNGTALANPVTIPSATPPIACMSASPASGPETLNVSYSGACSSDPNGSIVSYFWDFGDGTTGTGVSGHHYYSQGSYELTLTVTDNEGLTSSTTRPIFVTAQCTGGGPGGGPIICPVE